jgi:cell division protein FtsW (lipid II flippase)
MSELGLVGRLMLLALHGLIVISLSSTAESMTDDSVVNRTVL